MRSAAAIVGVSVLLLVACGGPDASDDTTDPNSVPASAVTQQELGVVRWKRNLPSSIDGLDADGNVVVSLQRDAREANGETQYAVRLHEHDNEARTQIAIGKNAFGSDTLFARDVFATPGFDPSWVLRRMDEDLRGSGSSLSSQSLRTRLGPQDEGGGSLNLVCRVDLSLVAGADTCLNHKSTSQYERDAWAKGCAKAQKLWEPYGSAGYKDITCVQQKPVEGGNINDCMCVDLSTATFSEPLGCSLIANDPGHLVHQTQDRVCSQQPVGQQANSCGKMCTVTKESCTVNATNAPGSCPCAVETPFGTGSRTCG